MMMIYAFANLSLNWSKNYVLCGIALQCCKEYIVCEIYVRLSIHLLSSPLLKII